MRRRALVVDGAIAAGFALLAVVLGVGQPWWLRVLYALPAAALVLRRRAPLVLAGVVAVSNTAGQFGGLPGDVNLANIGAYLFTIGSVAAYVPSVPRAAIAGAILGVSGQLDLVVEGAAADDFWPFRIAFVVVAWAVGRFALERRRQLSAAADHARLRAAEAVARERARLARELHDVIAHNVSVMVVQAGAAESVLTRDPGAAREALQRVQESGRRAILELRRLLGILRDDTSSSAESQPSLGNLDALVEQVRASGIEVALIVEGCRERVPASVDLSAYRILQEALTNVLRHSGAAHASVLVRYAPDSVQLEVADDGRGAAAHDGRGGHGLVGMRERVHLFGGTLEVGNRDGGGFAVRATLPLEGTSL